MKSRSRRGTSSDLLLVGEVSRESSGDFAFDVFGIALLRAEG